MKIEILERAKILAGIDLDSEKTEAIARAEKFIKKHKTKS